VRSALDFSLYRGDRLGQLAGDWTAESPLEDVGEGAVIPELTIRRGNRLIRSIILRLG
jgi:hypothetical protein